MGETEVICDRRSRRSTKVSADWHSRRVPGSGGEADTGIKDNH